MFSPISVPVNGYVKQKKEWINKARELYKLKKAMKALSLQEKQLMSLLKQVSNYENACGGGFQFTRNERIGGVEYDRVPELLNVDLSVYRKPNIEFWKLERI